MHLNMDAPQQMLPDTPLAPPLTPPLAPPTDADEETGDNMAIHSAVIVVRVRRGSSETDQQASLPHPSHSAGLPQVRPLHLGPRSPQAAPGAPAGHQAPSDSRLLHTMEALFSSLETDRSISPFYMSRHLSPVHCRPDVANRFLERTIRSAVEQHLFDSSSSRGQSSEDDTSPPPSPPTPSSPPAPPSARQRHRQQRQQRQQDRRHADWLPGSPSLLQQSPDKENLLSVLGDDRKEEPVSGGRGGGQGPPSRTRTPKPCCARGPLLDNQHTLTRRGGASGDRHRDGGDIIMESQGHRSDGQSDGLPFSQTLSMKIQESPEAGRTLGEPDRGRTLGEPDRGRTLGEPERGSCEDVPRLTALTKDGDWGEPTPAYSSWQRETMDHDEARLSPHPGGRLIRQLVEEEGDPMLSPRSYAYGHCQHYLDDTEVPPSPPNAHSFVSRRRSSSLGSCDDEREELTSAQLSKKIHGLKRKIRKYEEKFEDERKYRPSHSDKAGNPEVLRWMNELAKLRKDLKESRLMKSEEDLPPLTRQRSNTLPKSFGSQLEKKPPQERPPLPPVEGTLGAVQSRLQEKRGEVGRPDDIKDMTREQIGAEKVALQKALLYYEGIHGRPITKSERLIMKPLYDRYRLVKQILCRASTIPVIGSPSSKRRGPQLQPIIEGVPALFFDDIKEEEDGSEDEGDFQPPSCVPEHPDLSMLGFLEQLEEEGFISPVDELSPSRSTTDMRLSNLHSATMEELVVQLQEAREEKKRIRKNLREFEDQFFRQNGRNVQKEDRSPLAVEYNEYKHVKAKLRLLEVLISKRDSSKFI